MKRVCVFAALALSALLLMASAASAQVAPGTYGATFDDAAGPSGTHVANRSDDPTCTVATNLDVNCDNYTLGGVGNTNATALLVAEYEAIVDCNNPGNNRNNPIESHEAAFESSDEAQVLPGRNGQLRVPALEASAGDVEQVCPNDNWTPVIRQGTLELVSFTYTLTFDGFDDPFITISEP
jgi:hypothetical protein